MNTFTTVADDEWGHLTDEWQAPMTPPDLRVIAARVRRRTRWMRALLALEVVLTLAALVLLGSAARHATTWDAWAVIGGLLVFSVATWVFTLVNRRGTWRTVGHTLADYQALETRRHQRFLRATRFVQAMALICIPLLAWLGWYRARTHGSLSMGVLACAGAIAYLLGWATIARLLQRRWRVAPVE